MQSKPKIIAQAILLFAMAALFAVVPILSLQQEEITDLTTITATEIDNYIKKPVEMDSGDYKILSGSSMWERHQAAGEEPSGDYVTAFYPLEVYAKSRTPAGEVIGAVISSILAVLSAVSGIALLTSTKRKENDNGTERETA